MDQSNYPISENLPLGRLVANAQGELERLEYSRRSRDRYRAIWGHLIEFSRQRELGDEFSGDLAACFVEEYRMGDEEVDKPGEGWRRHIVVAVKMLEDFAQTGRIGRARTDIEEIHLCPATKKVLRDYEQYCKDRLQLRPATLQKRTGELTIFLDFLSSRKARTLDQIQALDLSEFLSFRGHLKPHTVSRLVSDIRSFLRFLTMRGILQKDLSAELPTSVFPEMPVSPRCGITSSSLSFSGLSIAVRPKVNEITPFSCWHAGWDCVPGIFAH
jgi:Phage integrase, N-terminal SAM-like domain